jgi:Mrp family chromosome partitioning ATPase
MAQEVVEQLNKSGCRLLGVVRNNRKQPNRRSYYRKYYKRDSVGTQKNKK